MRPEHLPPPEYRKTYEIVGWAYEADLHCPTCAASRFGAKLQDGRNPPQDREGNPVHPVFLGDLEGSEYCGDCGSSLAE